MGIIKSYPVKKLINGEEKLISEVILIKNSTHYKTKGESVIIVKNSGGDETCTVTLDELTTEHLTIKSMGNTIIKTNKLIDEEYEEIQLDKFASVELRFIVDNWYVMSSDGLKNS
jgi:hypothetical protein|tara:strand:+ start:11150 stop:11494 length:345 start_codon:yes stop_codon:yes gene_type:complete